MFSKHYRLYSELQISKNCNSHLLQQIIQLVKNAVTNSQYHEREVIVPEKFGGKTSEEKVCKILPLTGVIVIWEEFQSCHHLKKRSCVIAKFKCRKQGQFFFIKKANLHVLHNYCFRGNLLKVRTCLKRAPVGA